MDRCGRMGSFFLGFLILGLLFMLRLIVLHAAASIAVCSRVTPLDRWAVESSDLGLSVENVTVSVRSGT